MTVQSTGQKILYSNWEVMKHLKADNVWIANTAAFSAISASLSLNPSTSQLLSETNYLESYIGEDSGLRKALQEILRLSPDLTRLLASNTLEATTTYFDENSKLFSIHSFINSSKYNKCSIHSIRSKKNNVCL